MYFVCFFCERRTAYDWRICDCSTDLASPDLAVRGFVIGNPWQEKTHLGPISSPRQLARIDSMVQAAIASGARVVTGGSIIDGPDNFFAPTKSEERRVGKACVSTCRSRWSP